jgi:PIN domain nuclease of toxin-antitoxin system
VLRETGTVYVLDACAVVAFLRDEPGAPVVEAALTERDALTYMHAVNLAEVYYVIARDEDEDAADAIVQMLIANARVTVCRDLDEGFCGEVGRLRVTVRSEGWRISLADCFCLATARRLGGRVLTTDRTEFQRLIPHNWCPIQIIG